MAGRSVDCSVGHRAPAITAIWLAQGRIPAGVHPPEQVIEPDPFFAELKKLGIETRVTVTRPLG